MPAALKLGAALAMMSAAFFAAVNRLPLGPVSTIAFLGPLSVALIGARRARPQALGLALVDGVCVALILAPFASGIQGSWTVDPLGLGFALVTAFGCALFIVLIRCVGSQFSQSDGLCNSLLTATLLLAATGLGGLERILDMSVIWMGAALAILAPLLTCWSAMAVLRKIRPQSFGILMRLEPAIATVLGLVILHGAPSPQQILGMDCVILASAAAVVLLSRKPDLA
jgi:inner membrane transporter RhtA